MNTSNLHAADATETAPEKTTVATEARPRADIAVTNTSAATVPMAVTRDVADTAEKMTMIDETTTVHDTETTTVRGEGPETSRRNVLRNLAEAVRTTTTDRGAMAGIDDVPDMARTGRA